MSLELSRARSTGPFVKTVASATWLSPIEGFRSAASSSSTRVESFRCRSSFPSFFCA